MRSNAPMRRRGLIRLWLVATAICVPGLAFWATSQNMHTWNEMDRATVNLCVDKQLQLSSHPDAIDCARKAGAYRTMFEHEHTTPGVWWSEALGIAFAVDLVVTALLV